MRALYRSGRGNSTTIDQVAPRASALAIGSRLTEILDMLTRRSRAREVALQLLFQHDQNPTPVPRDAIERFVRDRLHQDAGLAAYCLALYDCVVGRQSEIDPVIASIAENWRLARMSPVDRNVLRLSAFELLFA